MNLYEINAEILEVMNMADEDGEISPEMEDALRQLSEDFITKADNVAAYIKNLEAEAKAIKDEELKLYGRRKAKENHASRLKEYLAEAMQISGNSKIETPRVKLLTRISQSVNVTDLAKLPQIYHRVKITDEADKVALAAVLKSGKTVDGAELVDKVSVTIK